MRRTPKRIVALAGLRRRGLAARKLRFDDAAEHVAGSRLPRRTFKKIFVLGLSARDVTARRVLEDVLVAKLKAGGVEARAGLAVSRQ